MYRDILKFFAIFALVAPVAVVQADSTAPENQEVVVTSLLETVLPDLPKHTGSIVKFRIPPLGEIPAHRHDANTFVYVLSGAVTIQTGDSAPVELTAGGTIYEAPGSVHAVTKNTSATEPTEVLVFFVKHKDAVATEFID